MTAMTIKKGLILREQVLSNYWKKIRPTHRLLIWHSESLPTLPNPQVYPKSLTGLKNSWLGEV